MTEDMVQLAQTIAAAAHTGQVDKAGAPYITHPERVAKRLDGDLSAQAAAWLHDVVEDTGTPAATLEQLESRLDELRAKGIPPEVVRAVGALTRLVDEDPDSYYARVAADPVALKVKRADLADNSDPQRLAALDEATRRRLQAKYAHAQETLASLQQ